MNASAKIVSRSKRVEWRGLDRINEVVHAMGCIWREQEKDDIGIDGEIELCRPREDGGEGLIGTGRIVKVQSKSGSSYVVKDRDDAFASPTNEKDLSYWMGLNVPIIYVVYHPDDDILYWKDVKAHLRVRPEAISPPYRIEFDKARDRFDSSAYEALFALCEAAPERISFETGEKIYGNLLRFLTVPKYVWVTPVLPEKRSRFHDRLTGGGIIPPYAYTAGTVMTLTDPTERETALTPVIDAGAVEEYSLDAWLAQEFEYEDHVRTLLNGLVHRHLRSIGLDWQKKPRRYFFRKGVAEDSPLKRTWTNSRTRRTQSRLVAKYYTFSSVKFFRHQAMGFRIERFGPYWALIVEPALHFTVDGERVWEGEIARSYAIRARAEQYNDVYLRDVLFWAYQLSAGGASFDLKVGKEIICQVSGVPEVTDAPFSIQASGVSAKQVKGV